MLCVVIYLLGQRVRLVGRLQGSWMHDKPDNLVQSHCYELISRHKALGRRSDRDKRYREWFRYRQSADLNNLVERVAVVHQM